MANKHRDGVALKQKAKRRLTLLEFGDIGSNTDAPAVGSATVDDANPPVARQVVFIAARSQAMLCESLGRPFVFPTNGIEDKSFCERGSNYVFKACAGGNRI